MVDSRCNNSSIMMQPPAVDYSNMSFLGKTEFELDWNDYLMVIIRILLFSWTIFGNAVIVFAVLLNNHLKTTTMRYLTNLAVADLLIGGFGMLHQLILELHHESHYVLGAFSCKFSIFAQMTCLTSSVLTLSAISCDRFIAIMFPLHVRITKQRTSAVITAIWIISMLVSIPFPIYRTHIERQWKDFLEVQCSDVWPEKTVYSEELGQCIKIIPAKKVYYTFVTITLFFLPIFVMMSSYSLIIWRLWVSELPGERNVANINVHHRAKKKVIKMVLVVLLVFIVCWVPLQIIVFYSQYGHSSYKHGALPEWFKELNYYATFIAYSNSALNPIIYGGFNKNFRQAFWKIFKCRFPRRSIKRPRSSTRSTRISTSRFLWRFSKNRTLSTFHVNS